MADELLQFCTMQECWLAITPDVGLMNGREKISDELLSAYLEGELSASERHNVECWLSASQEHQQQLEELRGLLDAFGRLPRRQVAPEVTQRIMDAVASRAAAAKTVDTDAVSDEMLSVYLDGESSEGERAAVEAALIASEYHAESLAEMEALERCLRTLPRYHLGDDFPQRVLASLSRDVEEPASDTAAGIELAEPATHDTGGQLRGLVWAAITIAAAILLMVVFRGGPEGDSNGGGDVRGQGQIAVENDSPSSGFPVEPQMPDIEARGASAGGHLAVDEPPRERDATLQMVNAIRKNCGRRLILVYEVLVTPEGVQDAAFENALRRQGIRFQDTVPVSRSEQSELIRERFLPNLEIVDSIAPNMDEIEMYLVACTGRIADQLYFDLKRPPAGIDGFMLNLATIDAEQGVLHRLAEAAELRKRTGEAVQLLVDFAMLSSAPRQVGVFGTIGYVEPELLDPRLAASPAGQGDAFEEQPEQPESNAAPETDSDFACELLFVVRKERFAGNAAAEP